MEVCIVDKNVATALSFVLGGGLGAFIAYKVCKKKYEKIAKEEIESIKKKYVPGYGDVHSERCPLGSDEHTEDVESAENAENNTHDTVTVDTETGEVTVETHKFDSMFEDEDDDDRPNMIIDRSDVAREQAIERAKYESLLAGLGYVEPDPSEFDDPKYQVPYAIAYQEFEENRLGYKKESLYYHYEDDILVDEDDYIVNNYDNIGGVDTLDLDNFDGYDDVRSMFIRNDRIKTLYEIILV